MDCWSHVFPPFYWWRGILCASTLYDGRSQPIVLLSVARRVCQWSRYSGRWQTDRSANPRCKGTDLRLAMALYKGMVRRYRRRRLKVQSSPDGVVEIFTARGAVHYSFTQDGRLVSSASLPEPFLSLPRGESFIVPTSPFLWVFSSPFLSWGVGVIGLVGLAILEKVGIIAAQ
jgi:hypothetical protein